MLTFCGLIEAHAQSPLITSEPQSTEVNPATQAQFSVSATGVAPLTFQWGYGSPGSLVPFSSGSATNTTCTASPCTSVYTTPAVGSGLFVTGLNVVVAVTDANSNVTYSTPAAVLTVNTAPAISLQPLPATAVAGGTASFTAAATGYPAPTYQWKYSANGGTTWSNFGAGTGTTSASMTTDALPAATNGWLFEVVASNTFGGTTYTATSNSVLLTVDSAPAISIQPLPASAVAGGTASFSVTATGYPTPTYQWKYSSNGGTSWNNFGAGTGTTSASMTTDALPAALNGWLFEVVATNSYGGNTYTATSTSALLTVDSAPAISLQPLPATAVVGGTATFTAAATGYPAPTYQWKYSANGGTTWSNFGAGTGTTSASMTTDALPAATNGWLFEVVATNTFGGNTYTATSNSALLNVDSPPAFTAQPSPQSVNADSTASFSATATGYPTPTYQWKYSANGGTTWNNFGAGTGTTSASMTTMVLPSATNGWLFEVVATNSYGGNTYTATSNSALLTVTPLSATVQLGSLSQTYTGAALSATATTTPSGKTVTFTYTGTGATSYPTTSAPPTAAGTYMVVGTVSDPYYQGSASGTMTIAPQPQVISFSPPANVTYLVAPLTLSATGGGSGNPVTFKVISGPANVSGLNGSTLTITGAGSVVVAADQAGSANYGVATEVQQTITVAKAVPTITWATPAAITYGTLLSGTQLNASPSTPSNCVYTPATGALLGAGSQILSVTCTPNDTADYSTPSPATTVQLQVNQATQTITGFSPSLTANYGDVVTLSATGGASGNAVTFSVVSGPASVSNGSTLTFTGTGAVVVAANQSGSTNYSAAPQVTSSSITVSKAPLTITASSTSVAYGSSVPTITPGYSAFKLLDNASSLSAQPSCGTAYTNTTSVSASPVSTSCSGAVSSNYAFSYVNGTVAITQATPTISYILPTSAVAVFGGSFTPVYVTNSDAPGSADSVSSTTTGVCNVIGSVVHFGALGTCTLTASVSASTNYTAATGSAQSFTVIQATPTISINNLPGSGVYGSGFTATYNYSGDNLPAPPTETVITNSPSVCTVSGLSTVTYVGIGTCQLQASSTSTPHYTAATGSIQNITVSQAPLTITPTNVSKQYGSSVTLSAFTTIPSSLYFSDQVTGLTMTSAGTAATATVTGAGPTYAIAASAATGTGLANYSITYIQTSTVTVTTAPLTITPTVQSKTYGSIFTFGTSGSSPYYTTSPLALYNSDTIANVTFSSNGTGASANAGTYDIVPSAATFSVGSSGNYSITYATNTGGFTVNAASLSITPTTQSKTYGSTFNYATDCVGGCYTTTPATLYNSDAISSVTFTSSGTVNTANAGNYTIVPSAATFGTGLASNYNITYNTAAATTGVGFTVNTAPLTITPTVQSKTYGSTFAYPGSANSPFFTITSGQTYNGDTVTGATFASSGLVGTASAGNYDITCSTPTGTGLTNYTITCATKTNGFTVNPAPLTITPTVQTKVYGSTFIFGTSGSSPYYTLTPSQLYNSDAISGVTLTSSGTVNTANHGTYDIVPSAAVFSQGVAGNYNITYATLSGGFTVTPKPEAVTLSNLQQSYSGEELEASAITAPDSVPVTFTYTGFSGTSTSAYTGGSAIVSPEGPVVPGNYTVTASFANGNYSVSSGGTGLMTISVGGWAGVGNLSSAQAKEARADAMTVLLPNGRVWLGGGYGGSNSAFATALSDDVVYDPSLGLGLRWNQDNLSGTARTFAAGPHLHGTATLAPNGTIVIVGGDSTPEATWNSLVFSNTEPNSGIDLYTPGAGSPGTLDVSGTFAASGAPAAYATWQASHLSSPVWTGVTAHASALLPNGKVLIAGGWAVASPNNFTANVWLYDPSTDTLAPSGCSLQTARAGATATTLLNGKVLIAGGVDSSGADKAADLYDPSNDSCTQNYVMNQNHVGHTATLLAGGQVLIAGGETTYGDGTTATANLEIYNPANNSFSVFESGSAATARTAHSAILLGDTSGGYLHPTANGGEVLLLGGYSCTAGPVCSTLSSSEIVTVSSDLSSVLSVPAGSLATARYQASTALLTDGSVLTAGGSYQGANPALTSSEDFTDSNAGIYTPAAPADASGTLTTDLSFAYHGGLHNATIPTATTLTRSFAYTATESGANLPPTTYAWQATGGTAALTVNSGFSANIGITADSTTPLVTGPLSGNLKLLATSVYGIPTILSTNTTWADAPTASLATNATLWNAQYHVPYDDSYTVTPTFTFGGTSVNLSTVSYGADDVCGTLGTLCTESPYTNSTVTSNATYKLQTVNTVGAEAQASLTVLVDNLHITTPTITTPVSGYVTSQGSATFGVTVYGDTQTGVNWSDSCGGTFPTNVITGGVDGDYSVSATYTAPLFNSSNTESCTITATTVDGGGMPVHKSTTITVVAAPSTPVVTITPTVGFTTATSPASNGTIGAYTTGTAGFTSAATDSGATFSCLLSNGTFAGAAPNPYTGTLSATTTNSLPNVKAASSGTLSIACQITNLAATAGTTATASSAIATLASVTVTPGAPVYVSASGSHTTQQFVATANFTGGNTLVVTTDAATTWSSGSTGVATIGASTGLASGVSAGTSTIGASWNGTPSAGVTLTVVAAPSTPVVSITPTAGFTTAVSSGATGSIGAYTTATASFTSAASDSGAGYSCSLTNGSYASGPNPAIGTLTSSTSNALPNVTAAGSGTVSIACQITNQALSAGATATANSIVATLSSITVTPAAPLYVSASGTNTTQQFAATAHFTGGSTLVITSDPAITWNTGTPGDATISTGGLATGVGAGTSAISATWNSTNSNSVTLTVVTAPSTPVVTLTPTAGFTTATSPASPGTIGAYTTGTASFTSLATDSGAGYSCQLTNGTFASGPNPAIGTLSATTTNNLPNVAAASSGTASIACTITNQAGSVGTTATASSAIATLASVTVTPGAPVYVSASGTNTTQQFVATANFTGGNTLVVTTDAANTWSSGSTGVATIGASTGLATGVSTGTSTIGASWHGTASTGVTLTVVAAPSTPVVTITPAGTGFTTAVSTGTTGTIGAFTTATAGFTSAAGDNGASYSCLLTNGTFASGPATSATGTLSSTTSNVLPNVTDTNTGTVSIACTITNQALSVGTTATANATNKALSTVSVTPTAPLYITATGSDHHTQQFAAVANFTGGGTLTITSDAVVSWLSGTPASATIAPTTGLATGAAAGTTAITATWNSITSNSVTLTVVTAPSTPVVTVVPVGTGFVTAVSGTTTGTIGAHTANSTASFTSANGDIGASYSCTINNSGSFNGSGLPATGTVGGTTTSLPLVGVGTGSPSIACTITNQAGTVGSTATATLTNEALTGVTVTPPTPVNITVAHTQQFTGTANFNGGGTYIVTTDGFTTWASSATGVATINSTGNATGVSVGASNITASWQGSTSSNDVLNVYAAPSQPTISIRSGASGFVDGKVGAGLPGNTARFWISPATITSGQNATFSCTAIDGTITAVNGGAVSFPATVQSVNIITFTAPYSPLVGIHCTIYNAAGTPGTLGTASANVLSLSQLTISPNSQQIANGQSQQFTLTAQIQGGGLANLTTLANWQSNATSVANIVQTTGVATAVTYFGTATITAQVGTYPVPQATVTDTLGYWTLGDDLTNEGRYNTLPAQLLSNGTTNDFGEVWVAGGQDASVPAVWQDDNLLDNNLSNNGGAWLLNPGIAGSLLWTYSTDGSNDVLHTSASHLNGTATMLTNGTVVIVGGDNGSGTSNNTVEIYDPTGNGGLGAYSTLTLSGIPLPALSGHTATLLNSGLILIAGGQTIVTGTGAPQSGVYLLNPANGAVAASSECSLVVARYGSTAILLQDGRVLIAGGNNGTVPTAAVDVYYPTASFGTSGFDADSCPTVGGSANFMVAARANHTATLMLDGRVLISGGTTDGTHALNTMEFFTPATDNTEGTFLPGASMVGARMNHSAVLVTPTMMGGQNASGWLNGGTVSTSNGNGLVLFFGGTDGNGNVLASGEVYDPNYLADNSTAITAWPASATIPVSDLNIYRQQSATITLPDGTVLTVGGNIGTTTPTAIPWTEYLTLVPQNLE